MHGIVIILILFCHKLKLLDSHKRPLRFLMHVIKSNSDTEKPINNNKKYIGKYRSMKTYIHASLLDEHLASVVLDWKSSGLWF